MKQTGRFKTLVACGVALITASLFSNLQAQTMKQGKAEVRAVRGASAKYSSGGGVWVPLKVGTVLKPGAIIQTGAETSVDLYLGANGPVLRVTPETTIALDRLSYADTGADQVIDTQLNLQSGRIVGNVKKLAAASQYQVKMPNGVAAIRGTDYDIRVHMRGNVPEIRATSVTGTLVCAGSGPEGTKTGVANTGETFIYPPGNVTPAPPDLLSNARREIAQLERGGGGGGPITTPVPPPVIEPFVSPTTGEQSPPSDVIIFPEG